MEKTVDEDGTPRGLTVLFVEPKLCLNRTQLGKRESEGKPILDIKVSLCTFHMFIHSRWC